MSETLGVCARKCVVAAVVWVSTAVVLFFFVDGNCACSRSQTRGGFPPGPRSYSRRVTPGLDGRGGGGKQKRPRRCGHTRAVSTCTVVYACCACYTGARETLGVCARKCVVAAVVWVSTAVVLFFFVDGNCACSRSQTRGGFPPGPRSSLRESLSTHSVHTLPSSTWCLVGWVPSTHSCHPTGKTR